MGPAEPEGAARLVVLDTPRVEIAGRGHALPLTLPGWLLVLLCLRGDWVAREELLGLLWPEEAETQAQHRLRVHLHRLRRLLDGWGLGSLLHAERQRVRVLMACDVWALRAALGRGERAQALSLYRCGLLQGWRLREFPVLEEWMDLERQQIAHTWRSAALRHAADLAAQQRHADALDLLQRVRSADPLAEDVVQQILRACAETGEAANGLRVYADFVERARAELAVEPMRSTVELAAALRDFRPPARPAEVPAVQPHTIPSALRDRAPFVGRASVVDWLRSGGPEVCVLSGPPGIGKTRTVEQALPRAAWLRCREALRELPLHPMLEVLRDARARIEGGLGVHASELGRLVPEYAPGAQVPADPQLAKPRLFEALVVAFGLLGQPIVIDDLQWADALTLEWLAYAAPRRAVRIVLIRREGEGGDALARTLRALENDHLISMRGLAPLAEAEVRELIAGLSDAREGPPHFSAWLARRSAGNPFYALEVLRHLFDAGQLRIEDGNWATDIDLVTRDYSELVVPPRVLAVTEARMARLSDPARRVLEAAAILDEGVRPDVEALAALAGLTADAVAETWEELDAAGFLQAGGIAHDLVRQSVQQSLSALRRERLHRRAADHLETAHAHRPADAALIARHWRLAGDPQRALPAAMQAAQAMRERGALEVAAEAFAEIARSAEEPALRLRAEAAAAEHLLLTDLRAEREALERIAAELAGLPEGPEAQGLKVRVHTALADNAVYAGELSRAARHVAEFEPLLGAAPREERLHALEMVVEVAMRRGEFDAAHAALAKARALWPGKVTFDIYEAMLAWSQVRLADAVRIFEGVAQQHPEHCRYIMVENDLGVALLAQGDLAGAEHWVRRGLATWEGIAHAQCLSHLNLGAILSSAGRWVEANEALENAGKLARGQHSALFEGEALHRLGRLRLLCGRPAEARELLDAAIACLSEDGDPLRLAQWHAQAVGAAIATGDEAKALVHLQRAEAGLGSRTHAIAQARVARAHAWMALAQRRAGDAQAAAERMLALARDHGLDELAAEALLLRARSILAGAEAPTGSDSAIPAAAPVLQRALAWVREADALASRRGLADLAWRAQALRARCEPGSDAAVQSRRLRDALFRAAAALSADAAAAARMEPQALPLD